MIWEIGRESGTRTGSAGECTKNAFPAKEETPACGGDERGKEKRGKEIPPHSQIEKTKRQSDKSHSFQKFKKLKISNILSDIETHNKFTI